jgi:hypothetical protein
MFPKTFALSWRTGHFSEPERALPMICGACGAVRGATRRHTSPFIIGDDEATFLAKELGKRKLDNK